MNHQPTTEKCPYQHPLTGDNLLGNLLAEVE